MSKMYIAVLDEVDAHMVPCLVGHAVLRHHMFSYNQKRYDDWFKNAFKKCVIKVNRKEFEKIRALDSEEFPITVSWENSTLGGEQSCITVVVHDEIPNVLKYAKLWKP